MKLFSSEAPHQNPRHIRVYATFELLYTSLDVGASLMFLIGSILFFWESLMTAGTVCFVVGSVLFLAKPISRLVREVIYTRTGSGVQALAERAHPGISQERDTDSSSERRKEASPPQGS